MRTRFTAFAVAATLAATGVIPAVANAAPASPSVAAAPTSTSPAAAARVSTSQFVLLPRAEAKKRPKLRRGDRGIWVKRVQRALGVTPASGYFGRATGKAVKKFRRSVGIKPRKKVNTRTWRLLGNRVGVGRSAAPAPAAPAPAAPAPADVGAYPTLQRGSSGPWVRSLQAALGLTADGIFGPNTEAAVVAFQTQSGLPPTGIVDATTWQALGPRVTPPPDDATMSQLARDSRDHRATFSVSAFVDSPMGQEVVRRESGGICSIVSANGKWAGKWQMDANFWSYYGGLQFAPSANLASCEQQDLVAFNGWVDRWWQPWSTAGV